MQTTPQTPVHEWLAADGTVIGLGTAFELDHWKAEGVSRPDERLGKIICHEPAGEDERRKAAWNAERLAA